MTDNNTSKFSEEQLDAVYNEDQAAQVKFMIDKAFILCESAVQDYIVAVSEKSHEFWGFTKIPTPYLGFKHPMNPELSVKIGMAVVDKEHMFPPDKCRPQAIRNEMMFMITGVNIVLQHILNAHRTDNPDPDAKSQFELVCPQYFNKYSKFAFDGNNSTLSLYCGEQQEFEKIHGRKPNEDECKAIYRLNRHQKRIGFVLGNKDTPTLGQQGHHETTPEQVEEFGAAMYAPTPVLPYQTKNQKS